MGQGIGRNDPCWCGSGKKYKRCHLGRDKEPRLQPWDADKRLRQYLAARCVVPADLRKSCSGDIVRAHTVPKSGSLQRIAVDGHVYAFVPSVQRIAKGNGLLAPELIGINRASTFTGFCAHHDKQLFAPVEDAPLEFTPQQCFLLAYRAMAREVFLKQAQLEAMGLLRDADKGRSLADQVGIQQLTSAVAIGVAAGADDAARHKKLYDEVLQSGNFSAVRSYVVTFDQLPSVMCSGGKFPYQTFDGTMAQDLVDLGAPAQVIHFTSFAAGDVGAVVFTWLPDSDAACSHFIESLQEVADGDVSSALIRFFFEYCENVQIAPEWWNAIEQSVRRSLVRRFSNAVNLTVARPKDCLLDDGLFLGDWGVRKRYRVGPTSACT